MRKIILVFIFLISISFVLAQNTPYPHAFYGNAYYSDEVNLLEDGYTIIAKIRDYEVSSDIINGTYDLIVEGNNGEEIIFYIDEEEIKTYIFEEFGITELDFITDIVKPASHENNDNDDTGGNNNGGGGGSGGIISLSPIINESGSEGNTTQTLETEEQEAGPGITGAVIGSLKSGEGIALLITFILIIILGIGVVTLKRKSPKNE